MFTIHRINNRDTRFAQVWALREEVLRRPLGLSLRDEDLSGEVVEHIFIVEDEDRKVFGCLMLRPLEAGTGKLRQMAVTAYLQGQGIGTALLKAAEDFAREIGMSRLILHARAAAIPFYERAGYAVSSEVFEEVGIPHRAMQKGLA